MLGSFDDEMFCHSGGTKQGGVNHENGVPPGNQNYGFLDLVTSSPLFENASLGTCEGDALSL